MIEIQKVYNEVSLQLKSSGLLFDDCPYVLGTGTDFDKILIERYQFFQTYLDEKLNIDNAFFVFGSKREYNAWALGDSRINILLIQAHVFIGNTLFYEVKKDQIDTVLLNHQIDSFYDNGLATVTIMRQTAEMYLFYHEVGHLIQAQEPNLFSGKRSEDNNDYEQFDIVNHIAELDADIFANVRIATHIVKILERESKMGQSSIDRTEKLCSVIIASYLLYRNLIIDTQPRFYTRKYKHPHLQIRMFAAIADISNVVSQNTSTSLNRLKVITLAMNIMDDLIEIHPQIDHKNLFVTQVQMNIDSIKSYYQELQNQLHLNDGTVFNKRNGYQ